MLDQRGASSQAMAAVPTIEHLVATCHLGDITGSSESYVFVAPFPCRLASARLVTKSEVPEAPETLWTIALYRHRGDERRQLVAKTTEPETGELIVPNVAWHFDVSAWDEQARSLATNDVVAMSFDTTGSPPPLRGVLAVLRYEPT